MPADTLLWYDYETTGTRCAIDRPMQFAAQRTTLNLEPIASPVNLYCTVAADVLPQPEACLLTGLTPQRVARDGLAETEFAAQVHALLSVPGTCSVGYNSIRFDDEINRFLFYRNFLDPYAHTWRDGTARWDILDLVRACHALRPEGIDWPSRDDGTPSFKLEALAKANRLQQEHAHDAASDVAATIALARLVRQRQPRLYDWHFAARNKRTVASRMAPALQGRQPLVHVSSRYRAERGCLAVVLPLSELPGRGGGAWIVADLAVDPESWMDLDAEDLNERLYTARADLPEGIERPPLKVIRANRSPFVAPSEVLRPEDKMRLGLDMERIAEHRDRLCGNTTLVERVRAIYQRSALPQGHEEQDPELALYAGFVPDPDRRLCDEVRRASPESLGDATYPFSDLRLPELLFRYRARNWPQTLSTAEHERWCEYVRSKLTGTGPTDALTLPAYRAELGRLRAVTPIGDGQVLLDELETWGNEVSAQFGVGGTGSEQRAQA